MQPIVHYLDAILAILSGAATRLRPHLDRAWRWAAVPAAVLVTRLVHTTDAAAGAAARLQARLGLHLWLWRGARRRAVRLRARLRRPRRAAFDTRQPTPSIRPAAPRLDPDRQWEIVVGVAAREIARASVIAALQARAALKIDAAEHALSRILADSAEVFPALAAHPPAVQPAPGPAPRPDAQPSRPLAA